MVNKWDYKPYFNGRTYLGILRGLSSNQSDEPLLTETPNKIETSFQDGRSHHVSHIFSRFPTFLSGLAIWDNDEAWMDKILDQLVSIGFYWYL